MFAAAVAKYLDGLGLVTYRPTGVGGNCFLGHMPSSPDVAVLVSGEPGGTPDAGLGYDRPGLQVIVRAGTDPRVGHALARTIYAALHGLRSTTLDVAGDDTVRVIDCVARQSEPVPLGRDENDRSEFSLNFLAHTVAPTTHRT